MRFTCGGNFIKGRLLLIKINWSSHNGRCSLLSLHLFSFNFYSHGAVGAPGEGSKINYIFWSIKKFKRKEKKILRPLEDVLRLESGGGSGGEAVKNFLVRRWWQLFSIFWVSAEDLIALCWSSQIIALSCSVISTAMPSVDCPVSPAVYIFFFF